MRWFAVAFGLSALATAGCDRTVGTITLRLLTSPNTDENPLPTDGPGGLSIEVRVEGPGAGVRRDTEDFVPGKTHLLVPAVTVGKDRVFTVTVRNARGDDVARARSLPHDMTGDDENIQMLLSLIGRPSEAHSTMTAPRFRHTATPLPDGRILLAGGGETRDAATFVEGGDPVPHAEIYDPTSGSIVSEVPDCERGRNRSLCLLCPRLGQVAGIDVDGSPTLGGGDTSACRDLYAERFSAGRFERGGQIDPTLEEAAAFDTLEGVVLAGGLEGGEPSGRSVLATGTAAREIAGGLSVARYGAAAAPLPDGGGVVVGGFVSSPPSCDVGEPDGPVCRARGTVSDSIDVFDPASRTFVPSEHVLAEPRAFATATALPDGRVVIVGGLGSTAGIGGQNLPTTTVEMFDPALGVSCPVATLAVARWMQATVALAARPDDGRIVVFGGYENLGELSGSIEVLDLSGLRFGASCNNPVRRSAVLPQRMRVRRAGHTATHMANGAILLAGGATLGDGAPSVSDVLDVFWLE